MDIVREVVEAGAQLDAQDYNGWTPLMHACCRGHKLVVRTLLSAGASVDIESLDGRTALHRAATWKKLGPLDQLIEAGADVQHEAVNKWTPLHCAAAAGDENACKMLVDAGANPSAEDSSGLTPMDVIADISAVKEVTNVLSRAMKRRSQHESRSSGASQSSTSLPTADSSPVSSDGGHHQRQIPDRIASPGVSTRGSSTESTPRRLSFNMGKTGSRHDYPYRENNYREEAESRPNTLGAGVCDDPCGASPEAYQDILPESDRFETSKDAVSQSGGGGGSSGGGSIRVKPLPPISSPGGYARRARAKVSVACDDEVLGHKQTSSDVRKELARGELSDERMGGAGSVITNDRNRFGHNANGVFTAAISCYGIADEGYQGCDVVNGAGVSREGDQQIEEERQENRGSSGGFHGDGEKGTSCGHYDKRRAGGADEPAVT